MVIGGDGRRDEQMDLKQFYVKRWIRVYFNQI